MKTNATEKQVLKNGRTKLVRGHVGKTTGHFEESMQEKHLKPTPFYLSSLKQPVGEEETATPDLRFSCNWPWPAC